jgi:hypothetical protein
MVNPTAIKPKEKLVKIRKLEYHTVISEFKYEIPRSEIIESFGSIENFEKAMTAEYGNNPELFIKFDDFMIDRDYDSIRKDNWISDRRGYDAEYKLDKK